MSLIVDTIISHLPSKRKSTPSGWISFNGVCCHHNGNKPDTRHRGGVFITEDTISYHCFNCGFKASWQPGRPLSSKFKNLMQWLSVADDIIAKCVFESLRLKDEGGSVATHLNLVPQFFDKSLPAGSKPLIEWINDTPPEQIIPILEYLYNRNYTIDDYPWYWSNEPGFSDRLIIPFFYHSRIVGYTARLCRERKTVKYLSEQQPGYVFNLDRQGFSRKMVFVTEGPLDAICIDGVAVMSNEINPVQKMLITRLQKDIVVVPDRDTSGIKLVDQALEWGWGVSFPEWDTSIKDVNDAVRHYGKLYTLWSIATSIESMPLKIQLKMKRWFAT